jgi:hypothetical protein
LKTLKVGRRSLCGKLECVGSASAVNIYGSTNKLSESSLSTTIRKNPLYKQHESVTRNAPKWRSGSCETVLERHFSPTVQLSNCPTVDTLMRQPPRLSVCTFKLHTGNTQSQTLQLAECWTDVRARLLEFGAAGTVPRAHETPRGILKRFRPKEISDESNENENC